MPASGLHCGWPQKTPIFQVYGTKRKANDERPNEVYQPEQMSNVAKRQCVWQGEESSDICMEINHNSLTTSPAVPQQICTSNNLPQGSCIVSDYPEIVQSAGDRRITNTVIQSDYPDLGSQNDHVMDLCDEVYTNTPSLDDACMLMDSDCVPNPSQYERQRESFCREYCGAGTVSPNSGRVRCYCKPSWEGMLDTRPYVSDVY